MLYKSIAKIKEVDLSKRIIMAYASIFNNVDSGGDRILPGAFAKTISENGPTGKNRIMHLWQHDREEILGKPSVIKEDETGLYFETKLIDTELGNDALKMYQEGILTEHSIGYNTVKAEWSKQPGEEGVYNLLELRLFEVSTVTWGMNDQARYVGNKSQQELIERIEKLQKAMYSDTYTDETFKRIEAELKQIETILTAKPEEKQEPVKIVSWIEKLNLQNIK